MQKLRPSTKGRRFIFPTYILSNDKNKSKGGFIDPNRIDTVLLAKLYEEKSRYEQLTIEKFIGSEDFYKIIFNTCYNASVSDDKTVLLSDYFSGKIASYLKNFFSVNNLGVVINLYVDNNVHSISYGKYSIIIKLNENITFEDIKNNYILELEKYNLSTEGIGEISGNQLTLKGKK